MPLNGSGAYSLPQPQYPAIAGTIIEAQDWNDILDDIASVLSNAVYVDGQAVMEAALKMGNFKILNLATGAADTDAVNYAQVFKNPTFTSTAGNDVKVIGEEFVVDPTTFTVTPDALNITVLTLAISATTTLTLSSSNDITLSATDDIFISPTDDLVVSAQDVIMTANTITFNGATKADLTSTSTAPNQPLTANGTEIVNMFTLNQVAMQASLPTLTGNNGKVLKIDGSGNVIWSGVLDTTIIKPGTGTDFATTTGTQTLSNKTYKSALFEDSADATKKVQLQLGAVAAGTTRNVWVPNEDVTIATPGWRLLSVINASNSATVDVESAINSNYDDYVIVGTEITFQTNLVAFEVLFKIGGVYVITGYYEDAGDGIASKSNDPSGHLAGSVSNAANVSFSFHMHIPKPAGTGFKGCFFDAVNAANGTVIGITNAISNSNAGALTGVRFKCSSGNIVAGTFKLFGIRKA